LASPDRQQDDGRQPGGFTAQQLVTHAALPLAWSEQREALGFT
jgi:hypothetical protein